MSDKNCAEEGNGASLFWFNLPVHPLCFWAVRCGWQAAGGRCEFPVAPLAMKPENRQEGARAIKN
jgi:hypothetical protein